MSLLALTRSMHSKELQRTPKGGFMKTYGYGFPRLGKNREYKKLIEGYWRERIADKELVDGIHNLEQERLNTYENFVDMFPVGEMTLYCNMLDTAIMVGLYPKEGYKGYFELCRGRRALKLTKWFNTNYHYLAPDFNGFSKGNFNLNWNKPKEEYERHKKGIPYLIGPFTFLKLSTGIPEKKFKDYLIGISSVYRELIKEFTLVHIDEPAFVLDISPGEIDIIKEVYKQIGENVYLFTYYEGVDFLRELYDLPVLGIGLDFLNGDNIKTLERYGFPNDKALIAGVIDGRNVWRTDIRDVDKMLSYIRRFTENIIISNSSPLYHLPITTKGEALEGKIIARLAFAEERLKELRMLSTHSYEKDYGVYNAIGTDEEVRKRVKSLTEDSFKRDEPYPVRQKIQKKILSLPPFPTTTIGSFPQTKDVREKRRNFIKGKMDKKEYDSFIKGKIRDLVRFEEGAGLDVLVHGEFERSDMVEFFAKKMDGIMTTKNSWIISYGTRGYRPPIIYGDVKRKNSLVSDEITYAQSLTQKPLKAILTGPITMIAWSFVREDIGLNEIAYQIGLCLQDEVRWLEERGIKIIQIDEPAFREMVPLKKRNWDCYFDWAIKSFRLASRAKPKTQVHTHMCYSEFGEILDKILMMDFDVISIEASRSRGALIEYLKESGFNRGIGPGVWDVHSPLVPSVDDMKEIVKKALEFIPRENIWINPDCGLKTRGWDEVKKGIRNIVALAKELRKEHPKE